jgi:tetratricopeptide (TPR) repeat protein
MTFMAVRKLAYLMLLGLSFALPTRSEAQPAAKPGDSSTPSDSASKAPDARASAKAEQLYLVGAALYRARKYRLAIDKFEAAYKTYPEANLLYNMARCYEALGRLEKALALYSRFAKEPHAAKGAKAKAEKRIKMLSSVLASAHAAQEKPDPDKPTRIEPKKKKVVIAPPPPPKPRRPSKALRVSKWVVGALGLALAGGGAAAFVLGHNDHQKIDDAKKKAGNDVAPMTLAEARSLRDDGNSKKVIGYALWGAAGAAVITSAILFIVDSGRGETRKHPIADMVIRTAIAPTPNGATWTLQARF